MASTRPLIGRVARELRDEVKKKVDAGWTLKQGSRHVLLVPPGGGRPYALPQKSTRSRTIENTIAGLRRLQ